MKEGDRRAWAEGWANAPRGLMVGGGIWCWYAFFQWLMGTLKAPRVAFVGMLMLAAGFAWHRYRRSRESK